MATIATKSEAEFEKEVLQSDIPVLVDFWAEWCPPCRMMAPILESLATSYSGKLKVVKVNVEDSSENQLLAAKQGVSGIPNMQIFTNGQKVGELIGARSQQVLEAELKEYL